MPRPLLLRHLIAPLLTALLAFAPAVHAESGHPKYHKSLRWSGQQFVEVQIPGRDRPTRMAISRLKAEKSVRINGHKLAPGDTVLGIYEYRHPSKKWLVPPSAEIAVTGPIAWVRPRPDDRAFSRVDLRTGERTDTPITELLFFPNSYAVPNTVSPRQGRYLARTLGMEEGQIAMIDEDGEVIRLIRDIDAVQPQVEHDHATMLALRKAQPLLSFHHVVRQNLQRGGVTETFRTLEDQPVQPLRGGGLVVRHRTPELGVFWSVYAADGSITIPATPHLVSVFAPVMNDTSAARNHTRYISFLIPLPEQDNLYWPILDDGTLLEADGLIGIRPLEGLVGRQETIRQWDDGFAPPWFATASLWDIGGQPRWALQANQTNSPALANAIAAAQWQDWEHIQVSGVQQLLLQDTNGQFRLYGDNAIYASRADARNHIARTVAEKRQREAEERARLKAAEAEARQRAWEAAESERANQWMKDFAARSEINNNIQRIEKNGPKSHGDVAYFRQHVFDKNRVAAIEQRWKDVQRSQYVPPARSSSGNWGTSSFTRSYGQTPMQRESAAFNNWVKQREQWNRDFDRRWGFDKRRY